MKQRYRVRTLPGATGWGIFDAYIDAFCALPPGDHSPLPTPLEWSSRHSAEVWLYRCRVAWSRELVPAPEGWDGVPARA